MSRSLGIFLFLLSLFLSPKLWAQEKCVRTPEEQNKIDLWKIHCVEICQLAFRDKEGKLNQKFNHNCEKAYAIEKSGTFEKAVDFGTELAKCYTQGALKAAAAPVEMAQALFDLVSSIFNSRGTTTNSNPFAVASSNWSFCEKSPECRRALARNTLRYYEQNPAPAKNWKIADEKVDREIAKMSVSELFQQVAQDRSRLRKECEGELQRSRRERDWKKDLQDRVPHCWTILDLHKAWTIENQILTAQEKLNQCLKSARYPITCFGIKEQMSVARNCLGEVPDLTEICAEGIASVVPLPGEKIVVNAMKGREFRGVGTEAREIKVASEAKPEKLILTSEQKDFVTTFKSKVFTSEQENSRFMKFSDDSLSLTHENKLRFFDVENSVMKKLNDKTSNRDLVTAVTNQHKEILLKNLDEFKKRHPGLEFEIYSDFKGVRLGIKNSKPFDQALDGKIKTDLQAVLEKTDQEFAKKLESMNLKFEGLGNPKEWFQSGYSKSADGAALAEKMARREAHLKFVELEDPQFLKKAEQELSSAEDLRQALVESRELKPLFEKSDTSGLLIPKEEVFDMIRKSNSPEELRASLQKKYGLKNLSDDKLKDLQKYSETVDTFSPALLQAKREVVGLEEARAGGLTADFLGLGAANFRATAEGIAAKKDLISALKGARQGEILVTKEFKARMQRFQDIVGGKVKCTGDDCAMIATKIMAEAEKVKIVHRLANDERANRVRLSFFGPEVPESQRMVLSHHGEAIEKELRKELMTQAGMSRKLDGITFALDMQSQTVGKGKVQLIVGRKSGVNLSGSEQKKIQEAFERATEKFNDGQRMYQASDVLLPSREWRLIPNPSVLISPEPQE